jgi:hypothetical protein
MYNQIILTDADGVFLSWEHGFTLFMLENGYGFPKEGHLPLEKRYGLTDEQAKLMVKMFHESSALSRLPPLRDSIKYIRKLHEDFGVVFHCITAVPNISHVERARWENIHNLFGKTPFERLILCDEAKNKDAILKQYEGSGCIWIEDYTKNAEYGLKYGLRCLLMDHYYNETYQNENIQRIKDWKDVYQVFTGSF